MLLYCLEQKFEWERVAQCVKHLGTRVHREAADCQLEFERIKRQWAACTRVVPTTKKLADAARAARAEQLQQRVTARERLVAQMRQMAANAQEDPDIDRLVRASARDPSTARMYARGDSMKAWRETYADEDDGFGPFPGHAHPAPPAPDVVESLGTRAAVAFKDEQLEGALRRPKRRLLWAPQLEGGPAADATFLWSVFESIADHRVAGDFQDPVTEAVAPGYVAAVKCPVCLESIRSELHAGQISTGPQLLRQLLLMTCNACVFNLPGTPVHQAALQLEELVKRECEPLLVVELLRKRMRGGARVAARGNDGGGGRE